MEYRRNVLYSEETTTRKKVVRDATQKSRPWKSKCCQSSKISWNCESTKLKGGKKKKKSCMGFKDSLFSCNPLSVPWFQAFFSIYLQGSLRPMALFQEQQFSSWPHPGYWKCSHFHKPQAKVHSSLNSGLCMFARPWALLVLRQPGLYITERDAIYHFNELLTFRY